MASAPASSSAKKSASRMTPYLTTSASPHRNSRAGSVRQRVGVDPDAGRLVEGADDVLGPGMVDPDLAADRAVDLGQQAGGDHEQRQAAGVGRRHEAGQVADHAAAEGDDDRVPVGLHRDQLVVEPRRRFQALGRLARRGAPPAGRRCPPARARPGRPAGRGGRRGSGRSRSGPSGTTGRPRWRRAPGGRTGRSRRGRRLTTLDRNTSAARGPPATRISWPSIWCLACGMLAPDGRSEELERDLGSSLAHARGPRLKGSGGRGGRAGCVASAGAGC